MPRNIMTDKFDLQRFEKVFNSQMSLFDPQLLQRNLSFGSLFRRQNPIWIFMLSVQEQYNNKAVQSIPKQADGPRRP